MRKKIKVDWEKKDLKTPEGRAVELIETKKTGTHRFVIKTGDKRKTTTFVDAFGKDINGVQKVATSTKKKKKDDDRVYPIHLQNIWRAIRKLEDDNKKLTDEINGLKDDLIKIKTTPIAVIKRETKPPMEDAFNATKYR